jgi:hypothetical protein
MDEDKEESTPKTNRSNPSARTPLSARLSRRGTIETIDSAGVTDGDINTSKLMTLRRSRPRDETVQTPVSRPTPGNTLRSRNGTARSVPSIAVRPIIIDTGSYCTRTGYADDTLPLSVIRTVVASREQVILILY